MPHNRYFASSPLSIGSHIEIDDAEFHHLTRVMRAKENDTIEVINGKGVVAHARVHKLTKDTAFCTVFEREEEPPSLYSITLALAFLKQNHLEFAIEKATEIGIHRFLLFPAERSEKKECSPHAIERLHSIIRSATKQCGRLFLPILEVKKDIQSCYDKKECCLYGTLAEAIPYRTLAPTIQQTKEITLFIGPESGFSHKEVAFFTANAIQGTRFCTNILRAETAAIVGAYSLIESVWQP